jgi:hypothetical protein
VKFKTKVAAAITAAAVLGAGLIGSDIASAHQSRAGLAEKRAVAAKAAGDCTLYGSGCLTDWATMQHGVDGDVASADVLMVGDSITNRCRLYLRARLVPYGLTIAFDYWSSRPTADIPTVSTAAGAVTRTLSYSRIYQPDGFKAVVMGDGTNDIFDPSTMAFNLARMKVIDSPVLWGNVYASRSTSYSADLRNTGWVNNQIQASGFPIVDWYGFLASYPGYRIPNYLADGIHPTYVSLPPTQPTLGDGSGCDAWAAVYAPRIAAVAV